MDDDSATKKDLAEFKTEMKSDLAEFKTEMKNDLAGFKTEMKNDLAGFRAEMKNDLAEFRIEVTNSVTEKVVGLFQDFHRVIIGHMEENFATKHELASTEDRLTEKIHDTETRLLRGYEHHTRATASHLTTLDGHTAANFLGQASLSERMAALEARMLDWELKKRPPQ